MKSFRLSFVGLLGKDASVEVVYVNHISREKIQSINIDFFDAPVVVPTEELEGIGNIQIETVELRYSEYKDGRRYCYVDAIFCSDPGGQPLPGPSTGKTPAVYKRVWFKVVEGEYVERVVFPTTTDYRIESTKPKGKPVTIRGEQAGAEQPATAPESMPESKDKPQPESKPALR
jgi:hypothetical protein